MITRKICFVLGLVILKSTLNGQSVINVASGTDFYIAPATVFTTERLSMTPSAGLNLNGNSIGHFTTVSNTASNNYISSVYRFANNTAPYSGSISFKYLSGELNGIPEADLKLNTHNGSSWTSHPTTVDAVNDFALSPSISNRILNEITLSNQFATLPLTWGGVTAWRDQKTVTVKWKTQNENNVSHFDVENSYNGQIWSAAVTNIPALNLFSGHTYNITDNNNSSSLTYYRIKQIDLDNKFTFSPVVSVGPEVERTAIAIYPNPVMQNFQLKNIGADKIKQLQLYNNQGVIVKSWGRWQTSYPISNLPAGIYHLQLELKDGSSQFIKITKH